MNLQQQAPNDHFWQAIDRLVESSEIDIDRPKGSQHPRFPAVTYPMDYGYLSGTGAIDGGGVDVWVGSDREKRVVGVLITVDLFKRDSEIKLLLGCTEDEMQAALATANSGEQSAMLVRRE